MLTGASSIATLHLICGLPCSGKTTLARHLEKEYFAVRLTPDEWITRILGADVDRNTLDAARDPVESVLWNLAERLLSLGVDVVLDFGVWSRREREDFRARAAKLGAGSKMYFLDVPSETLFARLAARNSNLPPGTFRIDEDQMLSFINMFESPSIDELTPREGAGR